MVVCLLPLPYNNSLPTIYPGYALWVASAVVVAMRGNRGEEQIPS
jgi:hypothetical protein